MMNTYLTNGKLPENNLFRSIQIMVHVTLINFAVSDNPDIV